MNKYLKLLIDNHWVDVYSVEDIPIAINYQLEDKEDFQKKKSSESFNIALPATLNNNKIFNSFYNPAIADFTAGEIFKSHRPCSIEAEGYELLVGKSFLVKATHDNKPLSYEINCYGDNADWMIDLKEATLYDFVKQIKFSFSKAVIEASWNYNGMSESLPYVFAPIRYAGFMDSTKGDDSNYGVTYMRPSLSVYWILYWGFKSIGYNIQSAFLDSTYFRRLVMPWTWGTFLSSEGNKYDVHKFLAKSKSSKWVEGSHHRYVDLEVSNDYETGGFDNNDDYQYIAANQEMRWTYKTNQSFGLLDATFSLNVSVNATATASSNVFLFAEWYRKRTTDAAPVLMRSDTLVNITGPWVGRTDDVGNKEVFFSTTINPGDYISVKLLTHISESKLGRGNNVCSVNQFKLDYLKIPLSGQILFDNYLGLQKYKFLDLLRGIVDAFNLSIQTDAVNKIITIEPTHAYATGNDFSKKQAGYFIEDYIDWSPKQDISKVSTQSLYSDYEREVIFKFKEDSNDGVFKLVQDRNLNKLATGKYVFPDRFKAGNKEHENRFFSATMHYEADGFKAITGIPPQMICIVPENISNTSSGEAENTFMPKLAWYKGLTTGVGGWRWDGANKTDYPFLFAVNYKPGGQNDPILSYSDEKIGNELSGFVKGSGLLKRFFHQRLAIMRNGQWYTTHFRLNNYDISNGLHRAYIIIHGQKYELIAIKDYKPLQQQATECILRRHWSIHAADEAATFPSVNSILNGTISSSAFDMQYARLMCLSTDIPK